MCRGDLLPCNPNASFLSCLYQLSAMAASPLFPEKVARYEENFTRCNRTFEKVQILEGPWKRKNTL